ncbi:MAG: pentapeptide repeat-containing protein [Cyanobacteria bacterium J06638_22]
MDKIDEARRKKGWAKTEPAWANLAGTSTATLKRFWVGVTIHSEVFPAICEAVGIQDWESIVEAAPPPSSLSRERLAFEITRSIEEIDRHQLDAIVAQLRNLGGDESIQILDIDEGSNKLILGGSQKALEEIEVLFKIDDLPQVEDVSIQDVHFLERHELASLIIKNGGDALNLSGVDLRCVDLRGTTLRHTDLRHTDLFKADLSFANLSGAILSGDLSGTIFHRTNLIRAHFHRAHLLGANFYGANLSGADLRCADLGYSNFRRADLSGADFHCAKLSGANLSEAILSGVDINGSDISYTTLHRTNLRGADLHGASLIGANIRGSTLRGVDLRFARLCDANIRNTDLCGVDFSRAEISGAVITNCKGLSPDNIADLKRRGAIFDDAPGDRE